MTHLVRCSPSAALVGVVKLAFCRPIFRNLASFQVGWPFGLFWPHLKLADLKKYAWHFGSFLAFLR